MYRHLPLMLAAIAMMGADAKKDEHGHTLPHPNDPVLRAEHMELLELVPDSAMTHSAVRDGAWSDKNTWKDGKLPVADANVLIPKGTTVTVDQVSNVALRMIRVDGKLQFAHDRDTALLVDTLVVMPNGQLVIGTANEPIAADNQAKLIFADRAPIDTKWDPTQLSRGLLSHGSIIMNGAPTTAHVSLARAPRKGDTTLLLDKEPVNWKKGDRLLLPSTSLRLADEERAIVAIDGKQVTIAPLDHDHAVPAEGLSVPLANLARNIIITSQNAKDFSRAGHVMFMHSPMVNIKHVAFNDLGRTNKRKPINDPKLDDKKNVVEGSGGNPRGRYAVHFHRTGTNTTEECPAYVKGCVVVNSPGWGFVNHSSYVDFDQNITFNVAGSGFVTEAGDEVGAFRNNLAVRSIGSGDDVDSRRRLQDFGHEGDGFWFQGAGVTVENNIAAGHAQTGFIYFTVGLEQAGLGKMKFQSANLADASWARGLPKVEIGQVPIRSFKGNIAFASHTGFITRHHLSGTKDGGPPCPHPSILDDSVVWNSQIGVHIRYSHHITLRNLRLVGNRAEKERSMCAVQGQIEEINRIRCENLRVEGWRTGVDVRESGSWVIDGGHYDNHINILIPTTIERGRIVEITGDIRFAKPDKPVAGHYDIYMGAQFNTLLLGRYAHRDPNTLFAADIVKYQGKQLYYPEQAADFVPLQKKVASGDVRRLGNAEGSVPEELLGLTNREMWEKYGLAVAGAVAPADATTDPSIHGLIGPRAKYPQPEVIRHSIQSDQLDGFKLVCTGDSKKRVAESPPTNLHNGWNLITLSIDERRRSFLVHGGKFAAPDKKYDKPAPK